MAIKANASSTGGGEFKQYIGVGSFRVLGVNPTKEELSKFYGNEVQKEQVYLTDAKDADGKAYKKLRVTFMIQADDPAHIEDDNKAAKEANAALKEPLKTTVSFFLNSNYFYKTDKSKVQVIDKYGRTAWVTIEQAKNHQIPVYKNGPARLDKNYRPAYNGEEDLTNFILNYLNVTPIDSYNKNTGEWITNPNPEDCEGQLEEIQNYFKGNIGELKKYCKLIPSNRVKLCVGVQTDDQGKPYMTVYNGISLRNGAKSYTPIKDSIDGDKDYAIKHGKTPDNTIYSDDSVGIITNIHEYSANVKETDLSKPVESKPYNPFEEAAALPEDDNTGLPFDGPASTSNDDDPFGLGVA